MLAIRRFRSSSSFWVGALFSLFVVLGIGLVSYMVIKTHDDTLIFESKVAVEAEIKRVAQVVENSENDYILSRLAAAFQHTDPVFHYAVSDAQRNIIASTFPRTEKSLSEVPFTLEHGTAERNGPWVSTSVLLSSGSTLTVARNISSILDIQFLNRLFATFLIIIFVLIALISLFVAYYVVSRINTIAATADKIIDTGSLSARLPIDSSWDDLSSLSIALNRMLAELEKQVYAIKTVSDNIAHDLRTPLARMRAQIESVEEPVVREQLMHDADVLLSMFNGLLRIAEVENTKVKSAFAQQNLTTVVGDVIELYGPLLEEKNQQLIEELTELDAVFDRDLIFQAIANVLDNAYKFTPDGGIIAIRLYRDNENCCVQICDSGRGIPADQYEKITQRFYRMEKSRSAAGFGLGMALVQAILKIHDGTLTFRASEQYGGLCCTLSWPSGGGR
ncbi:sensor histidine kinase [Alteromonas flava]|uniref:sensor histidine kinase n=1 Tax=Alteromonas flava TaxID=2048003 RepID=UPI000C28B822|nr:HAMP domain-containing sensor histidine kinase [Alteromonas flava]